MLVNIHYCNVRCQAVSVANACCMRREIDVLLAYQFSYNGFILNGQGCARVHFGKNPLRSIYPLRVIDGDPITYFSTVRRASINRPWFRFARIKILSGKSNRAGFSVSISPESIRRYSQYIGPISSACMPDGSITGCEAAILIDGGSDACSNSKQYFSQAAFYSNIELGGLSDIIAAHAVGAQIEYAFPTRGGLSDLSANPKTRSSSNVLTCAGRTY